MFYRARKSIFTAVARVAQEDPDTRFEMISVIKDKSKNIIHFIATDEMKELFSNNRPLTSPADANNTKITELYNQIEQLHHQKTRRTLKTSSTDPEVLAEIKNHPPLRFSRKSITKRPDPKSRALSLSSTKKTNKGRPKKPKPAIVFNR